MRIILLFLLLSAGHATAGAWLRAEGTGFLSTSVLQGQDGSTETSVYIEYGLRPRLTIGFKGDATLIAGQLNNGTVLVFARRPIPRTNVDYKLSYTLGLGADIDTQTRGVLRTQLSYGRGLTFADRFGWLAVDAIVDWSLADDPDTVKLDTTVGLTLNDRFKVMIQIFVTHESDTSIKLAPSLIWQPRDSEQSYQIGLEAEAGEIALRFGLWRDF
ncbi:MAG: hypothetical protein AAF601_03875 [Pseudomonadota bacterium]